MPRTRSHPSTWLGSRRVTRPTVTTCKGTPHRLDAKVEPRESLTQQGSYKGDIGARVLTVYLSPRTPQAVPLLLALAQPPRTLL